MDILGYLKCILKQLLLLFRAVLFMQLEGFRQEGIIDKDGYLLIPQQFDWILSLAGIHGRRERKAIF